MKIITWILQILVSAMFIMAGIIKVSTPHSELALQMPWVLDFSASVVKFIGASELIGGIGLLLPTLFRIKPFLSPIAGICLATVMLFAAVYHIFKGEFNLIGINVLLGGLTLFVAWARTKKVPVQARA